MKALIISDTHDLSYDNFQKFLKTDITVDCLFILGDVEFTVLKSIVNKFFNVPCLFVHGNHDNFESLDNNNFFNVFNHIVKYNNYSICGLEGCLQYKKADFLHSDEEISRIVESWEKYNIILSHNSPLDIFDKKDDAHRGYKGLADYIKLVQPDYVFCGHQHMNGFTQVENTKIFCCIGFNVFDFSANKIENFGFM